MIEKVWINNSLGEDNFVVIHDKVIYRLRAKDIVFDEVKYELSQGRIDKRLVGLPFIYVRKVIFKEDLENLIFHYNKESIDRIKIKDTTKRREIFDYIEDVYHCNYTITKPHFLKRAKKPLIAFGVVLIAFFLVIMMIEAKKDGTYFESAGMFAFLIYFAEFGMLKNCIGFGILLSLIGLKIWNDNVKNNEDIHTLTFQ